MMNSTLNNGFGYNNLTSSFVNGLGGFIPGLNNFGGGFGGQSPIGFGWNNQFNGLGGVVPGLNNIGGGFGGQSPIGFGWNNQFNGLGGFVPGLNNFVPGFNGQTPVGFGWNTPVTPFGTINPSFVGGWNGMSPIGFNGGVNTPSVNTWNGFTGQSPIGLGWNGQFNSFGGSFGGMTPFGGNIPFVSPVNTFPGFVPGYNTPSFTQGFVNTVNPTVNGSPISGIGNGPINTGNLYGQNTSIPSNGYNTPYTNSVPYSPFGVHTSATCAHAA